MGKKYFWIIIVIILIILGGLYLYILHEINSEQSIFVVNINNLSQDLASVETIPYFQSIENEGGGWFSINGNDANPSKDSYYTPEPVGPVNSEVFASSTGLSVEQIGVLTNIFEKYPYIERFEADPNINAEYLGKNNPQYSEVAIKFYLKPPLLSTPDYNDGYLYIPFTPSDLGQNYLNSNFSSVKEIAPNWYEFSGEHI